MRRWKKLFWVTRNSLKPCGLFLYNCDLCSLHALPLCRKMCKFFRFTTWIIYKYIWLKRTLELWLLVIVKFVTWQSRTLISALVFLVLFFFFCFNEAKHRKLWPRFTFSKTSGSKWLQVTRKQFGKPALSNMSWGLLRCALVWDLCPWCSRALISG